MIYLIIDIWQSKHLARKNSESILFLDTPTMIYFLRLLGSKKNKQKQNGMGYF